MMKRLPNHYRFVTVRGTEFTPDFYLGDTYISEVDKESVIESVFNNTTIISSYGKIDIIKKGYTDGWMRFKDNQNIVRFYGLQECKRNVHPTGLQLAKQLIQILGYYNNLGPTFQNQCSVFVMNSAYFYSYILKEDIEELMQRVRANIVEAKVSASKLYKELPDIVAILKEWIESHIELCHISRINSKDEAFNFKINEAYREIVLACYK